MNLTKRQFTCLRIIQKFCARYEEVFPGLEWLAGRLKCSTRTVKRVIATLKQRGLLAVKRRLYKTNLYSILSPEDGPTIQGVSSYPNTTCEKAVIDLQTHSAKTQSAPASQESATDPIAEVLRDHPELHPKHRPAAHDISNLRLAGWRVGAAETAAFLRSLVENRFTFTPGANRHVPKPRSFNAIIQSVRQYAHNFHVETVARTMVDFDSLPF